MRWVSEVEQILEDAGVTPGVLVPCVHCKGAGWVEYVTPYSETRMEIRLCPNCEGDRYMNDL